MGQSADGGRCSFTLGTRTDEVTLSFWLSLRGYGVGLLLCAVLATTGRDVVLRPSGSVLLADPRDSLTRPVFFVPFYRRAEKEAETQRAEGFCPKAEPGGSRAEIPAQYPSPKWGAFCLDGLQVSLLDQRVVSLMEDLPVGFSSSPGLGP